MAKLKATSSTQDVKDWAELQNTLQSHKSILSTPKVAYKLLAQPYFQELERVAKQNLGEDFKISHIITNPRITIGKLAKFALAPDINTIESVRNVINNVAGNYKSLRSDARKTEKTMEVLKEMSKTGKRPNKSSTRNTNLRYDERGDLSVARTNHPQWYLNNPTLVSELVGINIGARKNAFNTALRAARVIGSNQVSEVTYGAASIARFDMLNGISITQTQDWNQGVNLLFQNIRSANAGAVNYTPGMLSAYIVTIRSIDALLSTLGRAIKVLNSADFYDALSPQVYFAAMGLDYDSFASNSANARELYNRLSAIRYKLMPLNIDLLDRTRWLYGNFFKDSDDAKAQLYVFNASYCPIITTTPSGDNLYTLNILNPVEDTLEGSVTGRSYDEFAEVILNAFSLFQNDTKFQSIADNILKAYDKNSLYLYPAIPQNECIKPVFDIPVLTQIQNMTLSPDGNLTPQWDLTKDMFTMSYYDLFTDGFDEGDVLSSKLVEFYKPTFRDPLFNASKNSMSAGEILSATRLMYSADVTALDSGGGRIDIVTCGTEVCDKAIIYVRESDISNNEYKLWRQYINQYQLIARADASNASLPALCPLQLWSWFDYFPVVRGVMQYKPASGVAFQLLNLPPMIDLNNFGTAFRENLESYTAIATLSLLYKEFIKKSNKTEIISTTM